MVMEAYDLMKKVYERRSVKDEFSVFGEQVAEQLRHLPTAYSQLVVQQIINTTLFDARVGKYNHPPPSGQNGQGQPINNFSHLNLLPSHSYQTGSQWAFPYSGNLSAPSYPTSSSVLNQQSHSSGSQCNFPQSSVQSTTPSSSRPSSVATGLLSPMGSELIDDDFQRSLMDFNRSYSPKEPTTDFDQT